MAMVALRVVLVFQPLLQLAVASDAIGKQAGAGGIEPGRELLIDPQFPACGDAVAEQLANQRKVHGASGAGGGGLAAGGHEVVFSGLRRAGGQMALSILDEPGQAELRRAFHQRIGPGAQEFTVACEAVMFE